MFASYANEYAECETLVCALKTCFAHGKKRRFVLRAAVLSRYNTGKLKIYGGGNQS